MISTTPPTGITNGPAPASYVVGDMYCNASLPHGLEEIDMHRRYQITLALERPALQVALSTLNKLGDLQPGWDGDAAPAIDPRIIDTARELIGELADLIVSPFYVVPTLQGGVQLEWHRGPRELELELVNEYAIEHLFTDKDGGISEEGTCAVLDSTFIRGLITRVNGG